MMSRFRAAQAVFLLALTIIGGGRQARADKPETAAQPAVVSVGFSSDVRPIFEARCATCHGEKTRKADLDLTSAATLWKGGESGPVVVAGKPDESPLYIKVRDHEM